MAEEIGTGYVSVVPSLRGFSRAVQRALRKEFGRAGGIEVPVVPVFDKDLTDRISDADAPTIPVHLDPLTRALQTELKQVSDQLARHVAIDLPVNPQTEGLRQRLTALVNEADAGLTAQVPADPGDRREYRARLRALLLSVRETQHVRIEPDLDRSLVNRAVRQAEEGGYTLGRFFSAGFQGGLTSPLGLSAILGAVVVSLPFLGSIVGMATVAGAGLAALVVGGFLLAGDKELQAAVSGLFGKMGDGLKAAAAPLKGPFLEAIGIIAEAVEAVAPDVKDFFKTVAESGAVQELARGVGGLVKSLSETGALKELGKAIGPVLTQIGMALPDIGNAVSQFILSLTQGGNAQRIADFTGQFFRGIADVIRGLGSVFGFLVRIAPPTLIFLKAVGSYLSYVFGILKTIVTVVGWVIRGFAAVGAIAQNNAAAMVGVFEAVQELPGEIVKLFKWLWDKVTGGASTALSTVVGVVKGLPGRITSAVGSLATLLVQAGKNVIQGLIDGIQSKLGALSNVASSMAGTIRGFLPFSPAKEGPLSGSGNPYHSGQVIASDLAGGVESRLPTVASAAAQLAGLFGVGGPTLAGAGAAGGFTIDTAGSRLDQLLIEVLAQAISDRFGGDVDLAIGRKRRR